MAGVDMGSSSRGKRPMNAEINMIPFIDLLLVTVAFLLVTAVWVSRARLTANAGVFLSKNEKTLAARFGIDPK